MKEENDMKNNDYEVTIITNDPKTSVPSESVIMMDLGKKFMIRVDNKTNELVIAKVSINGKSINKDGYMIFGYDFLKLDQFPNGEKFILKNDMISTPISVEIYKIRAQSLEYRPYLPLYIHGEGTSCNFEKSEYRNPVYFTADKPDANYEFDIVPRKDYKINGKEYWVSVLNFDSEGPAKVPIFSLNSSMVLRTNARFSIFVENRTFKKVIVKVKIGEKYTNENGYVLDAMGNVTVDCFETDKNKYGFGEFCEKFRLSVPTKVTVEIYKVLAECEYFWDEFETVVYKLSGPNNYTARLDSIPKEPHDNKIYNIVNPKPDVTYTIKIGCAVEKKTPLSVQYGGEPNEETNKSCEITDKIVQDEISKANKEICDKASKALKEMAEEENNRKGEGINSVIQKIIDESKKQQKIVMPHSLHACCGKCGYRLPDENKFNFCPSCGNKLSKVVRY